MNSMSKGYYNDDCDYCKKDKRHDDDCCKKEKKPCPTIIKCSCPSSVTLSGGDAGAAVPAGTSVGSLNLNTSCLCDPCIKLEFASNLALTGTVTATNVAFQVFKLCGNQSNPIPVGPSWTFSVPAGAAATTTFSFFVCDCDSCFNDCCNYFVGISGSIGATTTLTVNNVTLGAIATCNGNNCKNNCC